MRPSTLPSSPSSPRPLRSPRLISETQRTRRTPSKIRWRFMMPETAVLPDLISEAQTTEEQFLRHIFVRDQMSEWSKNPLIMARADGVHYWDVQGKRYLDALSGIYVVSVGHNNRRVIEALHRQLDTLHFSPPMHGTNPVAIQLANLLAELAPGDLSAVKFQCGGSEVTEAAIKLA